MDTCITRGVSITAYKRSAALVQSGLLYLSQKEWIVGSFACAFNRLTDCAAAGEENQMSLWELTMID